MILTDVERPLSNFDLVEPLDKLGQIGRRNVNKEFRDMCQENEVWFTKEKIPEGSVLFVKPVTGSGPEYTAVRVLWVRQYSPGGRVASLSDEDSHHEWFWVDTVSFSKFWEILDRKNNV